MLLHYFLFLRNVLLWCVMVPRDGGALHDVESNGFWYWESVWMCVSVCGIHLCATCWVSHHVPHERHYCPLWRSEHTHDWNLEQFPPCLRLTISRHSLSTFTHTRTLAENEMWTGRTFPGGNATLTIQWSITRLSSVRKHHFLVT